MPGLDEDGEIAGLVSRRPKEMRLMMPRSQQSVLACDPGSESTAYVD